MVSWDKDLEAYYRSKAKDYRPEKDVKVLLIGESPPDTEDNFNPYFYNEKSTGSRLSDQIKDIMNIEGSKPEFLDEFADRGFYLIDIFPTYSFLQDFQATDGEKKAEMKKQVIERLTGKIVELEPDKILFIHKGATKELALPFPTYGNQPDFEEEFNQIIK